MRSLAFTGNIISLLKGTKCTANFNCITNCREGVRGVAGVASATPYFGQIEAKEKN